MANEISTSELEGFIQHLSPLKKNPRREQILQNLSPSSSPSPRFHDYDVNQYKVLKNIVESKPLAKLKLLTESESNPVFNRKSETSSILSTRYLFSI